MSKTLLVRLAIPIPSQELGVIGGLTFHRCLPKSDEDKVTFAEGDLCVAFGFDLTCIFGEPDITEEELKKHLNVITTKIKADVTIAGVSDELTSYIATVAESRSHPQSPLKQEYADLGRRVYEFVLTAFNLLANVIRADNGQFWLAEYTIDAGRMASGYTVFRAVVSVDGQTWCSWVPTDEETLGGRGVETSRYVTHEDWRRIKGLIDSGARPSLVWELLARAEAFAFGAQRRSSLIEATTALEVAISIFVKAPNAQAAFGERLAGRMGTGSLAQQREHLGLQGTVRYLFAVIFTEEQVPTELLATCQQAVKERNNVVHNGQRDVQEDRLKVYLRGLRRMCDVLTSYSDTRRNPPAKRLL
jgi:hypothetical protein